MPSFCPFDVCTVDVMLFTVSLGDHRKGVRTRNYLLYIYTTGFGTVCVFVLKSSFNNNLFPPWALFPGGCFNNHGLNHRRSLGRSSLRSYSRGGWGVSTPLYYPCWEAPPERGTFFKFLVCSV